MRRLEGRIAAVSGAGGIGSACIRRLAEEGATVVVGDISEASATRAVGEVISRGGEAEYFPVDLAREDSVASFVKHIGAAYGRIDILYNNAANSEHLMQDLAVEALESETWDRTFAVNARGTMLMTKHCIPLIRAAGGGSIINMSTGQSLRADLHRPAYAASKAAINCLTLYTAAQYGKQRIRCNAIAPGLILTDAAKSTWTDEDLDRIERENLLPYHGQPDDIAGLVAHLASDDARFITGQVLEIDGGLLSHTPFYSQHVDQFTQSLPS